MQDLQREILNQVASGAISAAEGADRLKALEAEAFPTAPSTAPPQPQSSTTRVTLVSRFGDTEVIGDPSVAVAVADGPHRARQEGDVLVIEQAMLNEASFAFTRSRARSVAGFPGDRRLTVRMNPALALSVKVQAGNLRVGGIIGPLTGVVQAGNCAIEGFRGPIDLAVTAGNIDARGRLDSGASSIRCQMGEVDVALAKDSNVQIRARNRVGEVLIEGVEETNSNFVTLGSGAGRLAIDCTMGSVRVSVE